MFPSPTRMFLTKGVGVHRHALTAFEFALRDADIEQQNLVYVSSILPPRCEVIPREAGVEIAEARGHHVLRPGAVGDQRIRPAYLCQSRLGEAGGSRHVWLYFGAAWLSG